jgi:hypothetical protein
MDTRSTTLVFGCVKRAPRMKSFAAWAMVLEANMSELPKVVAGFVTAGHAILFEDTETHRCDVCAEKLATDDDSSETDGSGRGLLVWSRGDERRYQEPPLCASCAAAIGVTALQRWEAEEDEG